MEDRRRSPEDGISDVTETPPNELPPFTAEERSLFMASLEIAEREIKEGDCADYDKATFLSDLVTTFRARKRARGA